MNKIINLILFFLIVVCSICHAQLKPDISIARITEIYEDMEFESIPFTINNALPITSVALSVSSSNTALVKNENLSFYISKKILIIKPEKDQYGIANITLTAINNEILTSTATSTSTLTLIVNPVNDPPSFNPGESIQITCTAGQQIITSWAKDITAGPYESDQSLSFDLFIEKPELFDAMPHINNKGDLIFTPASNIYGTTYVHVTLQDSGGTENKGIDKFEYQFTIETLREPVIPEFFISYNPVVYEDCQEKAFPGIIDITNTTDEFNKEMSFQVNVNNNELFEIKPSISNTGTLSFKPAKNAFGKAEAVVYLINEAIENKYISEAQSFSITILPVNDQPTFNAGGNYFVEEDAKEQNIKWASNINPGASNESEQELTFYIENIDRPELFEIQPELSSDGYLKYKPAKDMFGKANITLYLKDDGSTENNGIDTSEKHSFTIEIFSINDCPSFSIIPEIIVSNKSGESKIENWVTNIQLGPLNESNQTGSFKTYISNSSIFKQEPLITNDGTLIFEPDPYTSGTADVTVSLIDNGGSENNSCNTHLEVFTINVEALKYTMTLFVEGNGNINLNNNIIENFPWQGQLNADNNILLEAIPSDGWLFSNWSISLTETNAVSNIVMDNNKTIIAHFKSKPFILNLKGNGWVTLNDNLFKLPCTHEMLQNEIVNLKALNNFSHWSGDINTTSESISLTMNSDKEVYAHFVHPETWQTTLNINKNEIEKPFDPSAQVNDKIIIGVDETRQTSLDVKTSFYYCDIYIFSSEDNEYFSKEIYQRGKDVYQWNIAIQPNGNTGNLFEESTVILSWKPYEFHIDGQFQLIEGFDSSGEILINDMTAVSEYLITGTSTRFYTIKWVRNSYTFELQAGWNLISLPLIPENNDLSSIFPDSEIAYSYIDGSYEIAYDLEPGIGYWINIPNAETYKIYGKPFTNYSYTLPTGWHMLGALNEPASLKTIPDAVLSVIFAFVDGSYQEVNEIKPGLGYWVNVTEPCELILNKSLDDQE